MPPWYRALAAAGQEPRRGNPDIRRGQGSPAPAGGQRGPSGKTCNSRYSRTARKTAHAIANAQVSGKGAMRAIAVAAQASTENTLEATANASRPAKQRRPIRRVLSSQSAAVAATTPTPPAAISSSDKVSPRGTWRCVRHARTEARCCADRRRHSSSEGRRGDLQPVRRANTLWRCGPSRFSRPPTHSSPTNSN